MKIASKAGLSVIALLLTGYVIVTLSGQQRLSAQATNTSDNGRYVVATQTQQGIGSPTGVLWVVDSRTGEVHGYTLVLGTAGAILYAEIPKSRPATP